MYINQSTSAQAFNVQKQNISRQSLLQKPDQYPLKKLQLIHDKLMSPKTQRIRVLSGMGNLKFENQLRDIQSQRDIQNTAITSRLMKIQKSLPNGIPRSMSLLSQTNQFKPQLNQKFGQIQFDFNQQLKQVKQTNLMPPINSSQHSFKKYGVTKAYAVNTHIGLYRNYNEDRISVILGIQRPLSKGSTKWPQCQFYGIYDGHAGAYTSDYLRDNLHSIIIMDEYFPSDPQKAIRRGILKAEQNIISLAQTSKDISGSCAIVLMILDKVIYVANVGDSRAILSKNGGRDISSISRDHKPNDELERERIIKAGGSVYQSQRKKNSVVEPPFRVFPGRLSVSRALGDMGAKLTSMGGNPDVVIAEPDIITMNVTDDMDFILLGCNNKILIYLSQGDGVFDNLSTSSVARTILNTPIRGDDTLHTYAGKSVENLIDQVFVSNSTDNVSIVLVCLKNMNRRYRKEETMNKHYRTQSLLKQMSK